MADAKDKNIVIDLVIGGPSGQRLLKCYFKPHGDRFDFYDKDEKEKAKDVKLDEPFWFTLDEDPNIQWSITITKEEGTPDRRKLMGTWKDNVDPAAADGEFQAQAGGTLEEEEPNAASACA